MGVMGAVNAKELEATLGLRLEHPNIVRTFDYATRTNGLVSKPGRTARASPLRALPAGGDQRAARSTLCIVLLKFALNAVHPPSVGRRP